MKWKREVVCDVGTTVEFIGLEEASMAGCDM